MARSRARTCSSAGRPPTMACTRSGSTASSLDLPPPVPQPGLTTPASDPAYSRREEDVGSRAPTAIDGAGARLLALASIVRCDGAGRIRRTPRWRHDGARPRRTVGPIVRARAPLAERLCRARPPGQAGRLLHQYASGTTVPRPAGPRVHGALGAVHVGEL